MNTIRELRGLVEYVNCYLCEKNNFIVLHRHKNDNFSRLIKGLSKYRVRMVVCKNCGFLSEPKIFKAGFGGFVL